MLSSFAAMILLGQADKTHEVKAPVIGASVFKNGFVVVTRQIKVGPAGTYTLAKLPQSAITAEDRIKILIK